MDAKLDELARRISRQWERFGRETPLDGLMLTRACAPSERIGAVYRPSFCVVVQGAKISALGDQMFRYTAGQCLLASVDVPVTAQITEASPERPYLAFSLAIDTAMVADFMIEQATALGQVADFAPLSMSALTADLCDPLARLLDLLDAPRDLPVLAPLVQREIVWRLLCGSLGPTLRQIGLRDGHAARISRATAWIREHYAEPLRVSSLADIANMSVPSFHRHFKAVTTMTPVQFQKQIRLQEARRLLLVNREIAAVGYAIGYESLSQFSRDYRRLFGVPPGRDGAQIRARLSSDALL